MEHPGQFWIGTYPFRWSVFGWRQHAKSEEKLREYRQLAQQAQEREEKLARINHRLNARVNELEKLLAVREDVISGLQRQLNQSK